MELLLLALNCVVGVGMVFILKLLLAGDTFNQGTTLCALHYLACFYVFGAGQQANKPRSVRVVGEQPGGGILRFVGFGSHWMLQQGSVPRLHRLSPSASIPKTKPLFSPGGPASPASWAHRGQ